MLLLSFLVISIIIGWLRGGQLSRFENIDLRRMWILLIALGIQIFIVLFGMNGNELAIKYIKELYMVSYGLLIIYLLLNIKNRQLIIVSLGVVSNMFVFLVNSGKMPISIEGLKLAGSETIVELVNANKLLLYTPLSENIKYGFLSKIITIQKPFPFPQVLSIGDIIIALGLFIFIQSVMLDLVSERHSGLSFR